MNEYRCRCTIRNNNIVRLGFLRFYVFLFNSINLFNLTPMQTIYADGIANISLIDGVIRFDLVNILRVDNEKTNLSQVGTVAMSLPALLRTHDQLSKAIDKMLEDGILKKNDAPAQQLPADASLS